MSFTGISNLDRSIDKTNAWLAEIAAECGTGDRQFAYRITRAWLHALRDRLPVQVAANFAAQLPELLRGVFYGEALDVLLPDVSQLVEPDGAAEPAAGPR